MKCPRLRRQFYQIKHTRQENELGHSFGEAGPDRCLRVGLNKARYRRLPAGLRRFSISSKRSGGRQFRLPWACGKQSAAAKGCPTPSQNEYRMLNCMTRAGIAAWNSPNCPVLLISRIGLYKFT